MASSPTTAPIESGQAAAFAALCAGAVAMGISPVFVRFAAADVGPFASAFWRVALALPVLYAWMRIEEAGPGPARRSFTPAALFAGLAFAGDLFFWHLSILNTTVANATFFATTAPIFVVLASWLVLKRRASRETLAGLSLCVAGGVALIGQSFQVDPDRVVGDLYGVATAVFFALYFLGVERARGEGGGAARVTFALTLVTAAVLLAVALVANVTAGHGVIPHTPKAIAALVAMAFISHAGGQGLLAVALGRLPATFSSLVIFLEAIAGAAFGWIILGEALTPVQMLGGALILFGIWWARPRPKPAPALP
ncbi:DMT family transporter [Salinarimonas soli]|uniref:DMT family transporter n=1 Tax=Salinarimonas soli TaxID=1638099 RepID=A0A5B2VBF5_9HYPH|nr:DMT family transporter [Salinarimonas soli]KAA2235780.1 DMT family transporter [Salinarimonas soli]